jgi:hypothetical protein
MFGWDALCERSDKVTLWLEDRRRNTVHCVLADRVATVVSDHTQTTLFLVSAELFCNRGLCSQKKRRRALDVDLTR